MKQGWELKELGLVCTNLDSQRKPITKRDRVGGDIPYYGATGIVDYVKDYLFNEKLVLLGEDGAKWNKGDECAFIIDGKTWVNNHAHVLRPNRKTLLDEWLVYFLNSQDLTPFVSGMTVPKLNQGKMNEIVIPLPPLREQLRIVALLDEAFASIAKAKANAEQNLKNAKELFESYLQSIFANKGENWEEKMLKEIGVAQTGTTPKTAEKENYGDYIPFIKPADIDITGNGEIRYDNEGLSEQGLNNGRKMLEGSILMVCIGATIGKVGFIDRDVSCNQQINSLTVRKEFSPKFIYYALSAKDFFVKVIHNAAQATLPIINKGKWESLTVWYPKLKAEQLTIVKKLDSLSLETKKLEAIYQQKLNDLGELKKSILQKTFNGELKTV